MIVNAHKSKFSYYINTQTKRTQNTTIVTNQSEELIVAEYVMFVNGERYIPSTRKSLGKSDDITCSKLYIPIYLCIQRWRWCCCWWWWFRVNLNFTLHNVTYLFCFIFQMVLPRWTSPPSFPNQEKIKFSFVSCNNRSHTIQ